MSSRTARLLKPLVLVATLLTAAFFPQKASAKGHLPTRTHANAKTRIHKPSHLNAVEQSLANCPPLTAMNLSAVETRLLVRTTFALESGFNPDALPKVLYDDAATGLGGIKASTARSIGLDPSKRNSPTHVVKATRILYNRNFFATEGSLKREIASGDLGKAYLTYQQGAKGAQILSLEENQDKLARVVLIPCYRGEAKRRIVQSLKAQHYSAQQIAAYCQSKTGKSRLARKASALARSAVVSNGGSANDTSRTFANKISRKFWVTFFKHCPQKYKQAIVSSGRYDQIAQKYNLLSTPSTENTVMIAQNDPGTSIQTKRNRLVNRRKKVSDIVVARTSHRTAPTPTAAPETQVATANLGEQTGSDLFDPSNAAPALGQRDYFRESPESFSINDDWQLPASSTESSEPQASEPNSAAQPPVSTTNLDSNQYPTSSAQDYRPSLAVDTSGTPVATIGTNKATNNATMANAKLGETKRSFGTAAREFASNVKQKVFPGRPASSSSDMVLKNSGNWAFDV